MVAFRSEKGLDFVERTATNDQFSECAESNGFAGELTSERFTQTAFAE